MASYSIVAPNGKTYTIEGPEGATQSDVINEVLRRDSNAGKPDLGNPFVESAKALAPGLISGVGGVLELPGKLIKSLGAPDTGNALSSLLHVKDIGDYADSLKSVGLKAREALRDKSMSEASKNGVLSEFATAITSTLKDPALLTSFITEQLPQLIGPLGAAKITKLLGYGATAATSAAVGSAAVMQGADIGGDTYDAAYKLAKEKGLSDADAKSLAIQKARVAALEAGGISVAAQRLPGGKAIERRLAGLPGEGRIRGLLGEAASETLEEGGGKFASNVGLKEIDPNQSLVQGVGQAAGLGALGGGTMGGLLGAHDKSSESSNARTPVVSPAETRAAEAALNATAKTEQGKDFLPPEQLQALATGPNGYAELTLYRERLKQLPATKERNEALKEAGQLAKSILVNDVTSERENTKGVSQFLTAEEAPPDLLGDYVPPKEQVSTDNETAPAQVDQSRQSQLDFGTPLTVTDETTPGQTVDAFGGEGTNETAENEAMLQGGNTPQSISTTFLKDIGVPHQSALYKFVQSNETYKSKKGTKEGTLRLDRTSYVNTLIKRIEGLQGSTSKIDVAKALEPTLQVLKQEQQELSLEPIAEPILRGKQSRKSVIASPVVSNAVDQQRNASPTPGVREAPNVPGVGTNSEPNSESVQGTGEPPTAVAPTVETSNTTPVQEAGTQTPTTPSLPQTENQLPAKINKGSTQGPVPLIDNIVDGVKRVKKQSADYLKTKPGFVLPSVLADIKRLVGISTNPDESAKVRAAATNALLVSTKNFTQEELDAAKNSKLQESGTGTTTLEESQAMDDALRGRTFTEAIDFALNNTKDPAQRYIIRRIKLRAMELIKKGFVFDFSLIEKGMQLRGALGIVTPVYSGVNRSTQIDIKLNGVTLDLKNTLNQETLVHEFLHAVTIAQIKFAPQGSAAKKLVSLREELIAEFNKRPDAGGNSDEVNYIRSSLDNTDEVLAWGLTNSTVQKWLSSLKDKSGKTWLSKLFDIVRTALGIEASPSTDSQFARLLSISDEILTEDLAPHVEEANKQGKSFGLQQGAETMPRWAMDSPSNFVWAKGNVGIIKATSMAGKTIFLGGNGKTQTRIDIRTYSGTGYTPSELAEMRQAADEMGKIYPRVSNAEADMQQQDMVTARAPRPSTLQKVRKSLGNDLATGLRVKFVDRYAGVKGVLADAYKGIRDVSGNLNPMVLISQAVDAAKMAGSVLREGTLALTPEGIWTATAVTHNGREVSVVSIYDDMIAIAKREGKTYEEIDKTMSGVFYGHREYNLHLHNQNIDTQIVNLQANPNQTKAVKAAIVKLNTQRIYTALTWQQAQNAEQHFQRESEFKEIAEQQDTIRFAQIDAMVAAGRISAEKAQDWKDNIGYIPFERIEAFDKGIMDKTNTRKGLGNLGVLPKLSGSELKIGSTTDAFAKFISWSTTQAMQNYAASKTIDDLVTLQYAQPSSSGANPPANAKLYKAGILHEYYLPDPAFAAAFVGEPEPRLPLLVEMLRKPVSLLRFGVTATPAFAVKQVAEDIGRALLYSGVNNPLQLIPKILFNFPKIALAEFRGVKLTMVRNLEKVGVFGNYDLNSTDYVRNIQIEAGVQKRTLAESFVHYGEILSKASDFAVREAVYQQTIKEGGDAALAEHRAREVINFSNRGTSRSVAFISQMVPFTNAFIQGLDKLGQAIAGKEAGTGLSTGQARAIFLRRAGYVTAASIAYALMMAGDDDYEALPDYVKYSNWILPGGKTLGFTPAIPVAKELAFLFKTIPEAVINSLKTDGTKDQKYALQVMGALSRLGLDTYIMNPNPTALKAIIEPLMNYSSFMGRSLESQAQQNLLKSERYGSSTSQFAKDLSTLVQFGTSGASPIMIENTMRNIMGSSAGLMLSVYDSMANPTRADRPLHQAMISQLTGASTFMKDEVGTKNIEDLYDLNDKYSQVHNTLNKITKDSPEKVQGFYKQYATELQLYNVTKNTLDNVRNIRKQIDIVNKAPIDSVPTSEKLKIVTRLRRDQAEVSETVKIINKISHDLDKQ